MWQTQYNPYNQYQIGNSFPNYQNTYQQQPQQTIASGINGRYVDSFDSITANEVSMDGKPSLFIKNDMSEIQARVWNANGTISNFVFKPLQSEIGTNIQDDKENPFMSKLDALESKLDAIESRLPKPRTTKKDVSADE